MGPGTSEAQANPRWRWCGRAFCEARSACVDRACASSDQPGTWPGDWRDLAGRLQDMSFFAGDLQVHAGAAAAMGQHYGWAAGLSRVLVAPCEEGSDHWEQVDALFRQPVFAAVALAGLLIRHLAQD